MKNWSSLTIFIFRQVRYIALEFLKFKLSVQIRTSSFSKFCRSKWGLSKLIRTKLVLSKLSRYPSWVLRCSVGESKILLVWNSAGIFLWYFFRIMPCVRVHFMSISMSLAMTMTMVHVLPGISFKAHFYPCPRMCPMSVSSSVSMSVHASGIYTLLWVIAKSQANIANISSNSKSVCIPSRGRPVMTKLEVNKSGWTVPWTFILR